MVNSVATKNSTNSQKPKRRSPISRAEGERRLIAAATELVKTCPYSEVGVRDIAELADVNHGFVHNWFGSKNALLLAVVREQFKELADQVRHAAPGQPALGFNDPKVVFVVRVVLWLDLEGVDTSNLFDDMPILDALTTRFIEVEKIDPNIARAAASQAISIGLGASTFGPILGLNEKNDVFEIMALWRHMVGLLSKYPPA